MKRVFVFLVFTLTCFMACSSDDDNTVEKVNTILTFEHNWDGALVTNINFDAIQYTNANGELLSIERLRYVVSDLKFTSSSGEVTEFDIYKLIDVTNSDTEFNPEIEIPAGSYNVSFTFGLDNDDNSENYADLNSASFNVPSNLGGGYHYMQLDGKFINSNMQEQGYNYHAIRAVDASGPDPVFPQDTFFSVDLGTIDLSVDSELRIDMNIAEWFKNPNLWNLNELSQMLMPNAAAQILMYENGQSVFSLGEVIQYVTD